jgi:hypothetical protein
MVGAIEIARMLPELAMRESAGERKRAPLAQLLIFGVELAVAQTPTQLPLDGKSRNPVLKRCDRQSHAI